MKRRVALRPKMAEDDEFALSLRNELSVIAAGDSKREADPSWLTGMIDLIWAPVGYVRFDRKPQAEVEVSIALTPGCRDEGLGTLALTELRHRYGALPLIARVRRDNKSSLRAFEKAGFVEQERTETHVIFRTPSD